MWYVYINVNQRTAVAVFLLTWAPETTFVELIFRVSKNVRKGRREDLVVRILIIDTQQEGVIYRWYFNLDPEEASSAPVVV